MRIFVSDVRAELARGADRSELVRALLAYAVKRVWDCEMPEIIKDEKGKPYFAGETAMHFSLSHGKSHVLVALSEHPVGADVETLRPVRAGAKRLFSPEMLDAFGYFGAWTLREAVFKLRGEGSLRSMDIRLEGDEIVTPFEGVKCRLYKLHDCVLAAASADDEFPEEPERVESERFYGERA